MTKDELSEYFEEVSVANATAALNEPGDRRLAINAIMTLDGFLGSLHSELFKARVVTENSDEAWKQTLAKGCRHYQLLRDTAYALKHGNLTRPKPRLVRDPDKVVAMHGAFDRRTFHHAAFDTGRVWIAATDNDYRADEVIESVVGLARDWLDKVPA